jgi:hypothetical protein
MLASKRWTNVRSLLRNAIPENRQRSCSCRKRQKAVEENLKKALTFGK